ncbi:DEAD/DEAH box helicase [Entamoeba marina]
MKLFSSTTRATIQKKEIVEVQKDIVPTNLNTFSGLGLQPFITQTLDQLGIYKPTPIQQQCIPTLLSHKDVVGCAETGSGKTAAFALPIIDELSKDPYTNFALILTPTRELATQIAEQFKAFGSNISIRVTTVLGGSDTLSTMKSLSTSPHVVIATPGKLSSILDNLPFSFGTTKYLILDEADRLLDPTTGMLPDVTAIRSRVSPTATTGLFTATADRLISDLNTLNIQPQIFRTDTQLVSTCLQSYIFIPSTVKHCYLSYLVHNKNCIVFCSSVVRAEIVFRMLHALEVPVTTLHSALPQSARIKNLRSFRSGEHKVLVATDLAARGLDIPNVPLVVNYDIPRSSDDYVHRVGRTARAKKSGVAITLVDENNVKAIKKIEEAIGTELVEYKVDEDKVLSVLDAANGAKEIAFISLENSSILKRAELERKKKKQRNEMENVK